MPNSRSTILIVEDEENLREALKLNLELEGYEVTCAGDGLEALKKVENEFFDFASNSAIAMRKNACVD